MENRNEVKIGEGTYIVERSFTPGKSVKDLLVQRLISEKKKDDAKKKDDLTEIAYRHNCPQRAEKAEHRWCSAFFK